MRAIAASLLELLGLAAIVLGIWLIYPPAAWIAGGLGLVALALALERGPASSPEREQT